MHGMERGIDDLELMGVIVETGSFILAGERVGLTQSGVSRAVARLEARVGVRLFDRSARALALTEEGRRFHDRIRPLVGAIQDAFDDAAGSRGHVRGRLRVNVDPFCAHVFLNPRIHAFLEAYPELEIDVVVRDHADDFIAQGFDAALCFGDPSPRDFIVRRLFRSRVVTCASPSYLARRGTPKHPRDLTKGHECILYRDPWTRRPFDWEFHRGRSRMKVDVKGRLLVNNVAMALAACVAGHGIAQPLLIGVEEHLSSGTLVELFPKWRDELFPLNVLHPSNHLAPAKVRAFVDFVVAETRALSAATRD
jgi:DNA-binding transcriptional LysR family regulator